MPTMGPDIGFDCSLLNWSLVASVSNEGIAVENGFTIINTFRFNKIRVYENCLYTPSTISRQNSDAV